MDDAWDTRIERWLTYERRRINCGYAGFEGWGDQEIERDVPICDVSVGEILEGALGIEPARWTRNDQMRVNSYLKAKGWERYQARIGGRWNERREWRYRRP
jgi:putative DNA primase/helicase